MADREHLFFKILVFFAAVTAITGIINLTNTGTVDLEDIGSSDYGQTIPGQVSPNIGSNQIIQSTNIQDYQSATGWSDNFTKLSYQLIAGDEWTRSDMTGFSSQYTPELSFWGDTWAYLDLLGIIPDSTGLYTVNYDVSNSYSTQPYAVYVVAGDAGYWEASGIFLYFDQYSITAQEYGLDDLFSHAQIEGTETLDYGYASSVQAIKTVFDPRSDTVAVYADNQYVGTISNLGSERVTGNPGYFSNVIFYGGIAATGNGMQVHNVKSNFQLRSEEEANILSAIAGFFSMIGILLGLTSNALVPFWIWAIIGIPCLATLALIGYEMARGN